MYAERRAEARVPRTSHCVRGLPSALGLRHPAGVSSLLASVALGLLSVPDRPRETLDQLRREMRVVEQRRAHALLEMKLSGRMGIAVGHHKNARHLRLSS